MGRRLEAGGGLQPPASASGRRRASEPILKKLKKPEVEAGGGLRPPTASGSFLVNFYCWRAEFWIY